MIDGIGIDVVDIDRFKASLERTPGLSEKLFTAAERTKSTASLAARFAAKEALAKAQAEKEAADKAKKEADEKARQEALAKAAINY